jgi:hypothetical protein
MVSIQRGCKNYFWLGLRMFIRKCHPKKKFSLFLSTIISISQGRSWGMRGSEIWGAFAIWSPCFSNYIWRYLLGTSFSWLMIRNPKIWSKREAEKLTITSFINSKPCSDICCLPKNSNIILNSSAFLLKI